MPKIKIIVFKIIYFSIVFISATLSNEIKPGKWIFTFGNWTYDDSVIGFQSENHDVVDPITNISVRYPTVGDGNLINYVLVEIETNEGADVDCTITEGGLGKKFIQVRTLVKNYTKIHHQTTVMGLQPRLLTAE